MKSNTIEYPAVRRSTRRKHVLPINFIIGGAKAPLPPSVRASEIKHMSNQPVEKLKFITIEDDRTMHVLNRAVEDYMNTHRQHKAVIAHFYKFFETKLEVTKGA